MPAAVPGDRSGGRTVAVLLAAGGGSRYDGTTHKLLAPLGASTVFQRAFTAAMTAGIGHLVVVTGAVADLPIEPGVGVTVCHNPHWAEGQATSLQSGIRAARELDADAIVVGLGDQPFVPATAWRAVAAASSPIAIATYDGRRANPVRLGASVWPLLPTSGDAGARAVFAVHPELVEEVPCEGSPADIDTREDLERWT